MSKTAEEYSKQFDEMYGDHTPDLPVSKAEQAALKAYPHFTAENLDNVIKARKFFAKGYEQAEKDTIERAAKWLDEHFFDNSHHSGRGDYGEIKTNDFDSMEEMIFSLKRAIRHE